MKAISSIDFTKISPAQQSLSLWSNMWRKMYQNLTYLINGHIGFGDGVVADNIDGVWVNTTTPGGGSDFTVTHNLGRIPVGYIVTKADGDAPLFDGSIPPTTTQITWKSSGGATNIRVFVFLFLLSLFATKCEAQTTVNLNVTGTDSQVWAHGSWKVHIKQASGTSGGPPFNIISGGGLLADQAGALDPSGNATMSLPANANIAPAQSVWQFTVCPDASFPCFTKDVTVTVTSPQTLNLFPPPIVVNVLQVPPPVTAYTDAEITGAVKGTIYYNTTSSIYRQCNAASAGVCTAWAAFGGTAAWSAITGIPPACTSGTFVTDISTGACNPPPGGSGSVTSVSAGGLSPLFTASVATPTTTPAISFTAVSQAANRFYASPSGGSGVPSFRAVADADLPASANTCAGGTFATGWISGATMSCASAGGGGTVTSFSSGNFSPLFTTSVATPTTTPALSFTTINQGTNTFYAGPNGSTGAPTFRLMAGPDLPASTNNCPGGQFAVGINFGGTMNCSTPATAYTNWASTTALCSTTNSAGNSCTTTFSLHNTEVDTSYKISCTGVGSVTGFPAIFYVEKGTTNVTIHIINGESSMAQVSSYGEVDCVITR